MIFYTFDKDLTVQYSETKQTAEFDNCFIKSVIKDDNNNVNSTI